MSATAITLFFGDLEHAFDLAQPEIVRELEAKTGVGIGALVQRVVHTREFAHADLEHTIRLGLIGGGMSPKIAAGLVANYLPVQPLAETMIVAVNVLTALWFGVTPAETSPERIMNETAE
ncbi:gene transfer agent family protein [Methylobacterium sp. BTF04]|uniref:gene transfer agent family protein n=1 Tax=Methylobacterium sp. BTF04 TaxID=2708300 RepID=UPI0013D30DEF|nr:gene transfer agent family protein [Methylobacterium sp. BTF04]NEU14585.1 gene transfer agent family protein [Methylobacterium sp. BTF04]